jgi:twinkle protein
VLWGSFEIRNEILITSMLYQFSDIRLDKHLEKYEYVADKFSKLPLHFMNFYGSHSIEKILSTIVYSIEKHNVHMVVIDTLQFLLSEQADGFRKFELQDTLMAKLREISIKHNVHVVIVIHPRKTEDGEDIGIHSIYGTSKATQ